MRGYSLLPPSFRFGKRRREQNVVMEPRNHRVSQPEEVEILAPDGFSFEWGGWRRKDSIHTSSKNTRQGGMTPG